MANRNISATVQIGATMASSVGAVFGKLDKQINSLGGSLAKLKRQSGDITKLQAAQGKLAEAKAKGSASATARYTAQIEKLSKALSEAGVDTSRLTSEQARLASAIGQSESRMASMTRIGAGMSRIKTAASGVGTAFGKVKNNVTGVASKIGVLGGVAAYGFKTQFLDVAAEFERLQTILTTLEGGNVAKAKQAFGWISNFAAKTPYDIKQVSEAFVRLRAYGIDPIKGDTLKTLGDTASAMGKDVMSAVEAIADAVTGENERLKEFGIKAAKDGGRIIYSYTDRAGKQRQKAVDAGNRELIRSTLTAIWNEKYAGAMEAQSKTWAGMMSNMGDQWTRFTMRVMGEGLYDWMKKKLGGALDRINKAAEDGTLDKWAKEAGKSIRKAFEQMEKFARSTWRSVKAVRDFVGGWKNLGVILGAVMLAPTIASVGSLALAIGNVVIQVGALIGPSIIAGLTTLATTMKALAVASWAAAGPWFIMAAGIAAVGYVIYKFKDDIMDLLDSAINPLLDALREIGEWVGNSKIGKLFGLDKYNLDGTPQAEKAPVNALVPFRTNEAMKTDLLRQIMPAENMPAAGATNNVKQEFNMQITAPSNDPKAIFETFKSGLKSMKLYDQTGTLVPQ